MQKQEQYERNKYKTKQISNENVRKKKKMVYILSIFKGFYVGHCSAKSVPPQWSECCQVGNAAVQEAVLKCGGRIAPHKRNPIAFVVCGRGWSVHRRRDYVRGLSTAIFLTSEEFPNECITVWCRTLTKERSQLPPGSEEGTRHITLPQKNVHRGTAQHQTMQRRQQDLTKKTGRTTSPAGPSLQRRQGKGEG